MIPYILLVIRLLFVIMLNELYPEIFDEKRIIICRKRVDILNTTLLYIFSHLLFLFIIGKNNRC